MFHFSNCHPKTWSKTTLSGWVLMQQVLQFQYNTDGSGCTKAKYLDVKTHTFNRKAEPGKPARAVPSMFLSQTVRKPEMQSMKTLLQYVLSGWVLTQQVGLFCSKISKLKLPVNWEGSDCTIACHPFSEIGQHLLFLWAPYWNTVCPRIWRAMSIWSVDTWKISSFTTTRKD